MTEKVCFLVPTTSRGRDWKKISDALIVNTLCQSIKPHQTIFIGFDSDDTFFSNDTRVLIDALFPNLIFQWVEMQPDPGNVVAVWNTLAQKARCKGKEMLSPHNSLSAHQQVTEFQTGQWRFHRPIIFLTYTD
eukprot:COSAG02_NODE_7604_length_2937_cov_3.181113_2_plen_133_part_00